MTIDRKRQVWRASYTIGRGNETMHYSLYIETNDWESAYAISTGYREVYFSGCNVIVSELEPFHANITWPASRPCVDADSTNPGIPVRGSGPMPGCSWVKRRAL